MELKTILMGFSLIFLIVLPVFGQSLFYEVREKSLKVFRVLGNLDMSNFNITNVGGLSNGINSFKLGGALYQNVTNAPNSGTAETTAYNYTILSNTLRYAGDEILASFSGQFLGATTANKENRIYLNGTQIYDTGALSFGGNADFNIMVEIQYVNATAIRSIVNLQTTGASGATFSKYTEVNPITLSSPISLNFTVQSSGVGAGSGDVVGRMIKIWFMGGA